jgi:hypothetical protein
MMKQLVWIALGAAACTRDGNAISTPDAPGVAAGSLYVTVIDIGGRCGVTVADDPPSSAAQQTLADFEPGQTIPLTATATAGVTLGLWHHTTNDSGSGDPGTISTADQVAESATTVTLGDTPGCVWICCSSGSSDCSITDPCL